jgi:hypothetical protein
VLQRDSDANVPSPLYLRAYRYPGPRNNCKLQHRVARGSRLDGIRCSSCRAVTIGLQPVKWAMASSSMGGKLHWQRMRRLGARQFVECSSVVDTFSHKKPADAGTTGQIAKRQLINVDTGLPGNCCSIPSKSFRFYFNIFLRDHLPRVDSGADFIQRGTHLGGGAAGSLFTFSSFGL